MRRPRSDWMVMTSMNTHINVRMSESQRKAIEEKAAAMNMPASSFMRDAALLCGEKPGQGRRRGGNLPVSGLS